MYALGLGLVLGPVLVCRVTVRVKVWVWVRVRIGIGFRLESIND